jgi:uncharacterized peroxidase-related enzyme
MARIAPIRPDNATGEVRELLKQVDHLLGFVPNFIRTLAGAPPALQGYLAFAGKMEESRLPATLRAQIALAVSELHGCDYCVAGYSAVGLSNGLSEEHLLDGRRGSSPDRRADAALAFALELVRKRGAASDAALARVRRAGFDDGEVVEIVAVVGLAIFTNFLNGAARTDLDFPAPRPLEADTKPRAKGR